MKVAINAVNQLIKLKKQAQGAQSVKSDDVLRYEVFLDWLQKISPNPTVSLDRARELYQVMNSDKSVLHHPRFKPFCDSYPSISRLISALFLSGFTEDNMAALYDEIMSQSLMINIQSAEDLQAMVTTRAQYFKARFYEEIKMDAIQQIDKKLESFRDKYEAKKQQSGVNYPVTKESLTKDFINYEDRYKRFNQGDITQESRLAPVYKQLKSFVANRNATPFNADKLIHQFEIWQACNKLKESAIELSELLTANTTSFTQFQHNLLVIFTAFAPRFLKWDNYTTMLDETIRAITAVIKELNNAIVKEPTFDQDKFKCDLLMKWIEQKSDHQVIFARGSNKKTIIEELLIIARNERDASDLATVLNGKIETLKKESTKLASELSIEQSKSIFNSTKDHVLSREREINLLSAKANKLIDITKVTVVHTDMTRISIEAVKKSADLLSQLPFKFRQPLDQVLNENFSYSSLFSFYQSISTQTATQSVSQKAELKQSTLSSSSSTLFAAKTEMDVALDAKTQKLFLVLDEFGASVGMTRPEFEAQRERLEAAVQNVIASKDEVESTMSRSLNK